jgi:hypothetical protein
MAYAQGKYARAICDRCGFDVPYLDLKKEWTGFKVCSECYEPKSPQLEPSHQVTDPESLHQPRPTIPAPTTGQGHVIISNPKNSLGVSSPIMWAENSDTIGSMYNMSALSGSVGEVTLSGVAATPSPTPAPTPSPSTTTYTVTVASYLGSNYFYIDGSRAAALTVTEGQTYKFDQSDSSNSGHPLRFSTTSNGTHGGGTEYTTGVTTSGTPGSSGAYTQIEVASGAPTLYYYCTNHSGMGGIIYTT